MCRSERIVSAACAHAPAEGITEQDFDFGSANAAQGCPSEGGEHIHVRIAFTFCDHCLAAVGGARNISLIMWHDELYSEVKIDGDLPPPSKTLGMIRRVYFPRIPAIRVLIKMTCSPVFQLRYVVFNKKVGFEVPWPRGGMEDDEASLLHASRIDKTFSDGCDMCKEAETEEWDRAEKSVSWVATLLPDHDQEDVEDAEDQEAMVYTLGIVIRHTDDDDADLIRRSGETESPNWTLSW